MLSVLVGVVGLTACGGDSKDVGPAIVVSTSILGDVVQNLVGSDAKVQVVMPPNTDPHDFAPSARQAQAMRTAGVLVINGSGFEAGLGDTIAAAAADGVRVIALTDHVPRRLDMQASGREDPHVFTDPARMALAVGGLADELADQVHALDTPAYRARVAGYVLQLQTLDRDIEAMVDTIPTAARLLVTNHDVFGYFADRYGFHVLGSVIPSISTLAEPSGSDLQRLAGVIDARGVPAIFAETSSPARLADALAAEGTDVRVVELFTESLGSAGSEGATYLHLVRTNAERIVAALTPAGTSLG